MKIKQKANTWRIGLKGGNRKGKAMTGKGGEGKSRPFQENQAI